MINFAGSNKNCTFEIGSRIRQANNIPHNHVKMSLTNSAISTEALRVQLLKVDRDKKLLICVTSQEQDTPIIVRYGIDPENSKFDSSVENFKVGANLNLIDCVLDENDFLIPGYIILEPDYLIDASAIAECFQDYLISPLHYFCNKFEQKENRSYLLLGNLANFFLDELVFAEKSEEVSFDEVFFRSFKQSPFEYTSCEDIRTDHDFKEFMKKARQQFENIRRVIRNDFPKRGIHPHRSTLEPSFFCERFGFQGRLDLLQPYSESTEPRIVELKSGRLPYPSRDSKKIALNHEVQTAVYRLMVESVFGKEAQGIDASILYSAGTAKGENLRTATVDGQLEKEILNLRNRIVLNEQSMVQGENSDVEKLFNSLFNLPNRHSRIPSFFTAKIKKMQLLLSQCSEIERTYLYRFTRFISKELYHQKIGDIAYETPTGTAALWNSTFRERAEALEVISDLSIIKLDDSGHHMTIFFSRNKNGEEIVNFREGEICIVYPREDENDTVLNRQILKGSIAQITSEIVEVRFRYKQKNRRFFDENPLWAIEHDTLDSGNQSMYKSLFSFMGARPKKKSVLMGLTPPASIANASPYNVTDEKPNPDSIIQKAMQAQDYFLMVGPPGTGKTSIFARRLIEEYYAQPNKNIMVLAYTNRAVDELCDAIHNAFGCKGGECDTYIRIGTTLSCAAPYRHRLLQKISEEVNDRKSLLHEIKRTRIYVSTIASINGRQELFDLKQFDVAIIDEASQILEPQIIGLLPRFDRFVMIGDHNQLSTIVLQDQSSSTINELLLTEAGFTNCRDSLFERLIRRCKEKGWDHAYTQLTHQGRMHNDIAAFPATTFYSNRLYSIKQWQTEAWQGECQQCNPLDYWIASQRTALFSTEEIALPSPSDKINMQEADLLLQLLASIQRVYATNGKTISSKAIGIIAPYRNQIALIRHKLSKARIPQWEEIMIDTVERYQGSQRDVILISFCANSPRQMDFLSNLNHDGTVDRKLNVAITRARQQLYMVGNATILSESPVYAKMIDFYKDNQRYITL